MFLACLGRYNAGMDTMQKNDTGAGVLDVQQKLAELNFLADSQVTGTYDDATGVAVSAFCQANGLPATTQVNEKVWAALLDATFHLGDRTLYLRMPHFHGNDVKQLQNALNALGFACNDDGIFGAYTELALRKFQLNMGLPSDGIAGAFTYRAVHNLHHSWEGKPGPQAAVHLGFARASDVLERNALCLFGTDSFTRSVAARMSNLALATNPASKIVSADSLLVAPDGDMLLVQIVVGQEGAQQNVPFVTFDEEETLGLRLRTAMGAATQIPPRIAISLPSAQWQDAGEGRSAQHYAIALLDAICAALSLETE